MKNKIKLLFVSAIILASAGFSFSFASAREASEVKSEKVAEAQDDKGGNRNVGQNKIEDNSAVTTNAVDDSKNKGKKEKKMKFGGEQHRSVVASSVASLLLVADREGGIGQEVRVIAQQQNDIKDRAFDLINAIESRGKVKTFFIGTSYKNTGELRSQMVQTRNQIDKLKKLADKSENEQNKGELQTQIKALEQQQASIDAFITRNEDKFSLFGWAVKLFRK